MLMNIDELSKAISNGRSFFLAGEEELLGRLPKGNWIGGTIPYFMDKTGGKVSRNEIFATELPASVKKMKIAEYDVAGLPSIPADAYGKRFLASYHSGPIVKSISDTLRMPRITKGCFSNR